jgi:hypothetical protein
MRRGARRASATGTAALMRFGITCGKSIGGICDKGTKAMEENERMLTFQRFSRFLFFASNLVRDLRYQGGRTEA